MKSELLACILVWASTALAAQTTSDVVLTTTDSLTAADTIPAVDSVAAETTRRPRKLSLIRRIIRGFDRLDERYIEPQHYVFTLMVQATQNIDVYTMGSSDDERQTITFTANDNLKVGPYIGWKWFFAGYTFDVKSFGFSKKRHGLDLSVYSSQIGADLFFRRTGSDYKLSNAYFGDGVDTGSIEGVDFDGLKSVMTGLNLYYIFNHGRFSYPAAFAQSTCQKVSCGSWLAGFGYTHNTLEFDYEELQRVVDDRLTQHTVQLDSGLMFHSVSYADYNISAGYAYNWVFAPRWLFCASAQAALAYKKTFSEMAGGSRGFSFSNVNVNAIGRFALVYNNTKWYAGFSSVVRMNNYRKQHFYSRNVFGSLNLYVGFNFGLKKQYR